MPERCGKLVYAGHGYRIPCAHLKGFCPEHDLSNKDSKASPHAPTSAGDTSRAGSVSPAPPLFKDAA